MNKEQIEKMEGLVSELRSLSSTSPYCSITARIVNQNPHLIDGNIVCSSHIIECEIQAHFNYETLEAGMSKAVFADGREENLYFYTSNEKTDDEKIYVDSLDEALQKLSRFAKGTWYRGELFAHLHFGGTAKLEYVKEIYETGFIDQQTTDKALELSVLSGRPFIEYILSKGADIQANNNETLHEACLVGDLDIVRFLISHGADSLDTECILIAAREGHIDIVEYLLSLGANEAVARTYANADVDQYFQAKDLAQKLSSGLREKAASTDRTKI